MLILSCPNCGERNVSEFRFGGENSPRPQSPMAASEAEWAEYLYLRANKMGGVQVEWWYHQAGCGLWFLAERDWALNEVVRTYTWEGVCVASASETEPHDS